MVCIFQGAAYDGLVMANATGHDFEKVYEVIVLPPFVDKTVSPP